MDLLLWTLTQVHVYTPSPLSRASSVSTLSHIPHSHTLIYSTPSHTDLSDPSKFTRALRKESESTLPVTKPLVRRHTTRRALSTKHVTHTRSVPTFTTNDMGTHHKGGLDSLMTVSDLECSVTALELVQLQLDKQGE